MNNTEANDHLALWFDRLQDFVDGTADSKADAAVASHLESCAQCREEHANLLAVHTELQQKFAAPPTLPHDFASRVLTRIDTNEQARQTVAKQRAQKEFQDRMRAFGLDWSVLWQRHLGSIVAALTVFAALAATSGSLWGSMGEKFSSSLVSIPWLSGIAPASLLLIAGPIAISAVALVYLRTKMR